MDNNIEQQFLQLVQIMEGMQKKISALEQVNQTLIHSNKQMIEYIDDNQKELSVYQRNLYFELNDPRNQENGTWYPEIKPAEDAIKEIVEHRKSMARFGDGEFSTIAGRIRHKFQTEIDEILSSKLLEVLQSDEQDLLIGIADNYGNLEKYTEQSKREIRYYMNPQVRKEHLNLLEPQKIYYDAYVTRPYVMYADYQTDAPKRRFEALKKIWEKRNCIFIEGCYTRLGVGNDLFNNAKNIRRILAPAENAFSSYEKVLDVCLKQEKDVLFLLALGPTATVLSYDLCKAGYQAVDVGHVDMEYEWFLQGKGRRTLVDGKYNNEIGEEQRILPIENKTYQGQIIADFS